MGAASQLGGAHRRTAGASLCTTPVELAARCEVVISVITRECDVEQLALGPCGLIEGFRAGRPFTST